MRALLPLAAFCLLLGGCTQAQIDRAQAIDDAAHQRQAQADAALAAAQEALTTAKALAAQVGADKASAALQKAQAALDAAGAFSDATKAAVTTADAGLAAAKSSQAAGESTLNVLLAFLSGVVPTAGVAATAIVRAIQNGRAFAQTVRGIDAAKTSMGQALFDQHVAPALNTAQDPAVKAKVDALQAQA